MILWLVGCAFVSNGELAAYLDRDGDGVPRLSASGAVDCDDDDATVGQVTSRRTTDAWLDLSGFSKAGDGFLSPYTTTLVELYLDREPTDKLVRLR